MLHRKIINNKKTNFDKYVDKLNAKMITSLPYSRILYKTNDITTIDFRSFPDSFVIKPNDASGKYYIVKNNVMYCGHERAKMKRNNKLLCRDATQWLITKFTTNELWYHLIKPMILVEELLDIKYELRFHIIHNKVCFIECISMNQIANDQCEWYSREWSPLNIKCAHDTCNITPKPSKLEKYIADVEADSQLIDVHNHTHYLRLDTYVVHAKSNNDQLYFSEYTFAPSRLRYEFKPVEFEQILEKIYDTSATDTVTITSLISSIDSFTKQK